MTTDYETSRHEFEKLVQWYASNAGQRNEAATRLQLIDTLFFDCLGWSRNSDVHLEEPHGREYADYTFSAPRPILIVEAKREGTYFQVPAGKNRLEYSISSLSRDNLSLRGAVEQAAGYCQSRGVPFGAVSNGHQVVAFIGNRSDGLPPSEGKALVFPSPEFMLENFLELWQALSKPGVEEKKLQSRLMENVAPALPPKLSSSIAAYPGVKGRNNLQADLQIVSELVIEDLTRSSELEPRFLEECYSRGGALSRYALTSKAILQARYAALFDSESPGPTTTPASGKEGISAEIFAQSLSSRPIILIGDVGVGKTMFVRHLMKVDAASLFDDAITLYIDLGSQAALTSDIRSFVLEEIARQLREQYDVDTEERNFVRGVYNLELRRFANGIYADLREDHPLLYREKEIAFIAQRVSDREQHLKHSLEHITRGRQKQVVIFLDNADQRDDDTQESAFLITQELAAHWPATVFVALRPETFHRSAQVGALSGYHPKAFTISPPRIDRVIEKRLDFALNLTSGRIPIQALSGTTVNLQKLDAVIRAFCVSLDQNRELRVFIDNISGGNVRLALDLVRGFFGSGHVDTQKIIDIQNVSGRYRIPLHEFLRAVIFGDNGYYDPERSPIANLFEASQIDPREHFLLPLIISELSAIKGTGTEEGFVETSRAYERLQGIGFTPDQTDWAIVRGVRKHLIETSGRRIPYPGQEMPQALRATNVGLYHVNKLCRFFAYVDAVLVDIPIFDRKVRESIGEVRSISSRLENVEIFRAYLDESWSLLQRTDTAFNWRSVSSDLKAEVNRIRSRL